MLIRSGPMHGHQLRREAQLREMDRWADIQVGSLYAALHRMAAEGLIEIVRSEQQGRFPARTVYAITDEGRREFFIQRDALLRDSDLPNDRFDLALLFAADMHEADLRAIIEDRILALTAAAQSVEHRREEAAPYLNAREIAAFRHFALRVGAEVQWHRELLEMLPAIIEAQDDAPLRPLRRREGGDR
jgi:DNA-binding PadR family transcriptional regulator